jgi:hypothetical protein
MVPHETVWGMRPAGFHAFWGVPIGVYRMTGDEPLIHFPFSLALMITHATGTVIATPWAFK